jgi:hypothetical protein
VENENKGGKRNEDEGGKRNEDEGVDLIEEVQQ